MKIPLRFTIKKERMQIFLGSQGSCRRNGGDMGLPVKQMLDCKKVAEETKKEGRWIAVGINVRESKQSRMVKILK